MSSIVKCHGGGGTVEGDEIYDGKENKLKVIGICEWNFLGAFFCGKI